jgi:uncharacterized repeat protein (TIGR01451 family)
MLKLKTMILTAVMMTCSLPAHAAGVQLTNSIFKEVESKTSAGKSETKLVPAAVVVPGDKILFVMGYKNAGAKPAGNVVITNPVPNEVQYVHAEDSGQPVVSIDGGKTFGNLASLKIKNPDGSIRAARASDVTHVRWQILRTLIPGETGQVSFRGLLK